MTCSRGNRGSLTSVLIAITALAATLTSGATSGWARHHHHHKSRSNTGAASSDPCASPRAYVANRVAQMKALMHEIEKERNAVPRSLGAAIERMEGKAFIDREKADSLVELRHQANTVNSMMQTEGCTLVDIDKELAAP